MTLDILMGFLSSFSQDSKYPLPTDLTDQIDNTVKTVQDELLNLMNYMRTPSYNADAPFGKNLVEKLGKNFSNNVRKMDTNNINKNICYSPSPDQE